MDGGLGDDVGVKAVAQIDGVDVVAAKELQVSTRSVFWGSRAGIRALRKTYHSKSLYMMVKKTCRNRLTAFTNTDSRNNQASPDIMIAVL